MYVFASAGSGERGNAYLVRQEADQIVIYESVNNTRYERLRRPAPTVLNQPYRYWIYYSPHSGRLAVFRDGVWLAAWVDSTPLLWGRYLSLRTDATEATFDDISAERMTRYYWAGEQAVALRSGNSAPYYLLGDHLGSSSVLLGPGGSVVARPYYFPYGGLRAGTFSQLSGRR
jgi:hypothetical protein